jgi:hypothetical protein
LLVILPEIKILKYPGHPQAQGDVSLGVQGVRFKSGIVLGRKFDEGIIGQIIKNTQFSL